MSSQKISRRVLLGSASAALWPGLASAYDAIPQRVSARVIVDNDFAGDPDGLVALAHQMLTPKTRTALVTTTFLDPEHVEPHLAGRSAAVGRDTALELIRRAGIASPPPVIAGPERAGETAGAAARAIVAEAMRDDPLPLFFCCGGPLTNLAAALRIEPRIAQKMTLIWIGGGAYPNGGWEYNCAVDANAARFVIESSEIPLWQIPQSTYRQMAFSVAEMRVRLRTISPFGAWLYQQFTHPPDFVDMGGAWPMGDSPTVLLTAISSESSTYVEQSARRLNTDLTYGAEIAGRTIRVYERVDARLVLEDFFALMALQAGR